MTAFLIYLLELAGISLDMGIFQRGIQLNIPSTPPASQGFSIYGTIYLEWESTPNTEHKMDIQDIQVLFLHMSFYLNAPLLHSDDKFQASKIK